MENTVITEEEITKGLNPAQKQAVIQRGSPLLVLAGAGSGKTKVLTHRIAHLISNGVHSGSILSVTFTNKAAKEMKERVTKLVSEENIKYAWLGTFHSVCARILRQDIDKLELIAADGSTRRWTKNFTIFDETDSVNAVKDAIKTLDLDPKIYVPKSVRYRISEAKNEKKLARDFHSSALDYREEKIAQIYSKYEEIMCRNNAFDFDDLLLMSVMLLRNNQNLQRYYSDRFKHILVDEYQDTNHAQYELITLLATGPNLKEEFARGERTLTVVGDVDQSIYSWRGADYKIILGFQEDYPDADIIKLEHNYRSTETILKVANEIINNNTERIEKTLIATKSEGDKVNVFEAADEIEEAQYITAEIQRRVAGGAALTDFAILYRTNVQSRALEEALLRRNMPYVIVGGFRFYDRKEIKDMISYLKSIHNPSDSASLKRIINEPRRGIGATTITKIEEYANQRSYSLYRTMLEIEEMDSLNEPTKKKIKEFVDLMEDLRLKEKSLDLGDLVEELVRKSGYLDMLVKSSDAESESRIDNIQELIGVATDFALHSEDNSLGDFLAEVSLLSEQENTKDKNGRAVVMMTLHAAKGLEFPVVFLAGMEEGIFPHKRSLDSPDKTQLEEERRLMYVGVTRAEDKLYFTHARRRRIFGQSEYASVSRFIAEAPRELLQGYYGQSCSNESQSSFAPGYTGTKKPERGFSREAFTDDLRDCSSFTTDKGSPSSLNLQAGFQGSASYYDQGRGDDARARVRRQQVDNSLQHPAKRSFASDVDAQEVGTMRSMSSANSGKRQIGRDFFVEFAQGDRVKHSKFGEGKVLQVLGSGQKILYNVDFNGLKKLLDPKFAKLIKLG